MKPLTKTVRMCIQFKLYITCNNKNDSQVKLTDIKVSYKTCDTDILLSENCSQSSSNGVEANCNKLLHVLLSLCTSVHTNTVKHTSRYNNFLLPLNIMINDNERYCCRCYCCYYFYYHHEYLHFFFNWPVFQKLTGLCQVRMKDLWGMPL